MEGGGVNDKCQSTVYKSRYIIRYIYRRFVIEGGEVNDCCQYIDTTYSVECDVMSDGLMVTNTKCDIFIIMENDICWIRLIQLFDRLKAIFRN